MRQAATIEGGGQARFKRMRMRSRLPNQPPPPVLCFLVRVIRAVNTMFVNR